MNIRRRLNLPLWQELFICWLISVAVGIPVAYHIEAKGPEARNAGYVFYDPTVVHTPIFDSLVSMGTHKKYKVSPVLLLRTDGTSAWGQPKVEIELVPGEEVEEGQKDKYSKPMPPGLVAGYRIPEDNPYTLPGEPVRIYIGLEGVQIMELRPTEVGLEVWMINLK